MTVTTDAAPLLSHAAVDLFTHQERHGLLPVPGGERLIAEIEAAGLTGRGGGGFPTARKLAAVRRSGRPTVMVGNAAEGEPASGKDRALLVRAPHLVLDGLQLAAGAIGASTAHLYVPAESRGLVDAALADRRRVDWDRIPVEVVTTQPAPAGAGFAEAKPANSAQPAFVAGEESAVLSAIQRRRPLPRDTPRRIVEDGVLVQNVETLAHLALIARYGPARFRANGTADEPGTFLATVSGAVVSKGVYEAGYGIRLGDLLDLAGGPTEPLRAVLIGGYHGTWVPAGPDIPVSRAGLRPFGGSPGAGVVVALGASRCGLVASAEIAKYLAGQTAGQCGPCVNGLPRLADTLDHLARGGASPNSAEVERLLALVDGRGACRHPDGTARFVRSSLHTFAAEVDLHRAGRCSSVAGRRS